MKIFYVKIHIYYQFLIMLIQFYYAIIKRFDDFNKVFEIT